MRLVLQIVNIAPHSQDVPVALHNITWGLLSAAAKQTVIAGPSPQAENSFGNPDLVRFRSMQARLQCKGAQKRLSSLRGCQRNLPLSVSWAARSIL